MAGPFRIRAPKHLHRIPHLFPARATSFPKITRVSPDTGVLENFPQKINHLLVQTIASSLTARHRHHRKPQCHPSYSRQLHTRGGIKSCDHKKAPLAFTNGALKFFGWSAFSSLHRGPFLFPRGRLARGQGGRQGCGMVNRTRS